MDPDPGQQLLLLEDLLLLSRYQDAAEASAALISHFSEGGKAKDAFLQRALVIAFQANFFLGRNDDAGIIVDKLGLVRLAAPTLMAWVLLLLESGQAPAARLLLEQYMSLLVELRRHIPASADRAQASADVESEPQQHISGSFAAALSESALAAPTSPGQRNLLTTGFMYGSIASRCGENMGACAASENSEAVGTGMVFSSALSALEEGRGGGPGPGSDVGAAAATPQDRAALARLYSQDVLCQGLGLPLEALRWLQPTSATLSPSPPLWPQGQLLSQMKAAGAGGGAKAQLGSSESRGQVSVSAAELVGCTHTLRRLQGELKQLMVFSGLMPPQGLSEDGGGGGVAVGSGGAAPMSKPLPAAAAAGSGITAEAAASAPGADGGTCGGGAAASPSDEHHRVRSGRAGPPSRGGGSSLAARLAPAGLMAPAALSFLRALLTTAHALARRVVRRAAVTLTRAQGWLLCKAAAAAARLHGMSGLGGVGSLRGMPPLGHVAAALALGAVVLLAAQAEAPYLRTKMGQQWAALAGLVREALRMGLALHPSPVATEAVSAAVH